MKNKKTLILGASGLIGRYLYNFLKENDKGVVGTYNENKKPGLIYFNFVDSFIDEIENNFDYGVICSAVTKVDKCKDNPKYSNLINVKKTKKIIEDLSKKNIIPVFMSSASVFDGVKGNYNEKDLMNPTTLYGKQKAEIDEFITSNIEDYLIIRPGKVFGVKRGEGVLFTDWYEKYKNKKTIVCADDEKLSPTYAGDIARGISKLLEKNSRGVYHLNQLNHYSRFKMAKDFFNYLNIKADIIKCSIDDFNFSDKRPKNTYLDSSKFIKETNFKFTDLHKCYELIKHNCDH